MIQLPRLIFSKTPHDLEHGSIQNRGVQFLEDWQSKISTNVFAT